MTIVMIRMIMIDDADDNADENESMYWAVAHVRTKCDAGILEHDCDDDDADENESMCCAVAHVRTNIVKLADHTSCCRCT